MRSYPVESSLPFVVVSEALGINIVQIPLDHYRILGIPYHRATREQIQQAYRDRCQQQPPAGYSPAVLEGRESLLAAAFRTLSDPARRAAYDKSLSPSAARSRARSELRAVPTLPPMQLDALLARECQQRSFPGLEIPAEWLLGALLVLLEAGEYFFVKQVARACLQEQGEQQGPDGGERHADLVLLASMAHQKYSKELWQREAYQQAVAELEAACKLVATESAPAAIQRDLANDLRRLRPFEIWEILTTPRRKAAATQRALALLQGMLEERGGIDGTQEQDRSGLGVDEFLCFIQQLRAYLDADEQVRLFAVEARRSSAAAAYLLAYTQIARGYATRQPALLVEATAILERIERRHRRQDVSLERSVCALLLGQTERAIATAEQSQDRNFRAQLDRVAPENPDLLLRLCRFSEQWLHEEVLPQFRDLSRCQLTLKEYFADRQVQLALEQLLVTPRQKRQSRSSTAHRRRLQQPIAVASAAMPMPLAVGQSTAVSASAFGSSQAYRGQRATAAVGLAEPPAAVAVAAPPTQAGLGSAAISHLSPPHPPAGRVEGADEVVPFADGRRRRSRRQFQPPETGVLVPPSRTYLVWLAAFAGTAGLAATLLASLWGNRGGLPAGEHLALRVDEPLVALPPEIVIRPEEEASPTRPAISTEADRVLGRWLAAKTRAYGPDSDITALPEVLTGEPLAQHQQWASKQQQSGGHRQFQHDVAADSVRILEQTEEQLVFEATVRETATHHVNREDAGQLLYDSNLRVRYELVKSAAGQWKIAGVRVLEKLL